MKKKQVWHFIKLYLKKLAKQIAIVQHSFDPEAIHTFRVTYKKLRAFMSMLQMDSRLAGTHCMPATLKRLYKVVGTIRDIQLQQQRISALAGAEAPDYKGYNLMLENEIESLQLKFEQIPIKKSFSKATQQYKQSVPADFLFVYFFYFMQLKRANAISIVSAVQITDTDMHALRKNLKDGYYMLQWFQSVEAEPDKPVKDNPKDNAVLALLLQNLGDFHDKCVAISLLNTYWLQSLPTIERTALGHIKYEWILEKRRMKENLLVAFKKVFS